MTARTIPGDLGRVGLAGRLRGRPVVIGVIGLVILGVLMVAGVTMGSTQIGPIDTLAVLLDRLTGLDLGRTWTPATETIVWELRLPRVLTAVVVGAGLAIAGATFQGIVRNPLADPYVLGTSSGAALGAAIGIMLPVGFVALPLRAAALLAFIGAIRAALLLLRIARRGRAGRLT